MTVLTDMWMDNMRVRLPGALDGMIQIEAWNTVDELCRKGRVWAETIEMQLVTTNLHYDLAPLLPGKLVQLQELLHRKQNFTDCIIFERTKLSLGEYPTAEAAAEPAFLSVLLAPLPAQPVILVDLLPEPMWEQYAELIKDGVLSRMMSQPGKPYSNIQLATFHGKRFRDGMAMARHLTETGNEPGKQLWSFPSWA